MDSKSLSEIIKSELSLATSQPDPMQSPTSAALRASASEIPSPVIPTMPDDFYPSSPLYLIPVISTNLSSAVARAKTFNLFLTLLNFSILPN